MGHTNFLRSFCFSQVISTMADASPEVASQFEKLYTSAMKEGALSYKTKELIAISCAISSGCALSLESHIKAAIENGLQRAELVEAIGILIFMNGENALIQGTKALQFYDREKS